MDLLTRELGPRCPGDVSRSMVIVASAVLVLGLIGIVACLVPGVRAHLDPRAALNME